MADTDSGQIPLHKLISMVFGYLIILGLLIAAFFFLFYDTAREIGQMIIVGVLSGILGSGTLKSLKRESIERVIIPGEEQVDGPASSVLRKSLRRQGLIKD